MIPTSTLLMHLAEMMNRLGTTRHPDIEEFLDRHKDNTDFQLLACTARGLWDALHSNYTPMPEKRSWATTAVVMAVITGLAAGIFCLFG